jgi:hydrogenase nickel incorporation protein HypA/HybF
MHELSIAYNLVEIADAAARQHDAVRVHSVHLRLGALAGVVEDALRFGFPLAAAGTLVEGAALEIDAVAVQVFCEACAAPQTLEPPYLFCCPVCGKPVSTLLQGRELQIESIAIEEREEGAYATAHS